MCSGRRLQAPASDASAGTKSPRLDHDIHDPVGHHDDPAHRLAVDRPRIEVGGAIDSARAGEGVAAIRAAVQRIRDGEPWAEGFARTERRFGAFSRSFRLGKGVDDEITVHSPSGEKTYYVTAISYSPN